MRAHALHHLREGLAPQATVMVVGSVSKDDAGLADHNLSPQLAQCVAGAALTSPDESIS